MRVLRIADVSPRQAGGISRFMLRSGDALAARAVEVDQLFEEDLELPRAVRPLRRLVLPWVIAARIVRLARGARRPDVVEIHEPLAAPYAALRRISALRRRLPPCVVMSHGLEERGWIAERERARRTGRPISRKTRIVFPLTRISQARLATRWASQVLVLSTEDVEFLTGRRRIAPGRVSRINGGVDERIFSLARADSPRMRLLFVGSWNDRKGARELTEAWCRLRAGHPDLRLTLAGTLLGADRVLADVPAAARDRVTVVPTMDDAKLHELLVDHDVFVLPSWFEGMPLSMIEAAAAGLACVVTSVCGNLDFFRPADPQADGAILVAPHSTDAIVAALTSLAGDAELRARIGANARRRARAFTWDHTAEQALAAYHAALAGDPLDSGEKSAQCIRVGRNSSRATLRSSGEKPASSG